MRASRQRHSPPPPCFDEDAYLADEIHVLSPHRDDAMLTFGGFILGAIERGRRVTVHIVFGSDGYIDRRFVARLRQHGTEDPHWRRTREFAKGLPVRARSIALHSLDAIVIGRAGEKDWRRAGQLFRRAEEAGVAAAVGYRLRDYPLLSAWPHRGYTHFDSPLTAADHQSQRALLISTAAGKMPQVDELGFVHTTMMSPLPALIARMNRFTKRRLLVLAPAGIGGHPDHVILARMAAELAGQRLPNVQLRLGEDLPYATCPTAFRRAPLSLRDLHCVAIDISPMLNAKCRVLRHYDSQLRATDIRAIAKYHRSVAQSPVTGIAATAVEMQYAL